MNTSGTSLFAPTSPSRSTSSHSGWSTGSSPATAQNIELKRHRIPNLRFPTITSPLEIRCTDVSLTKSNSVQPQSSRDVIGLLDLFIRFGSVRFDSIQPGCALAQRLELLKRRGCAVEGPVRVNGIRGTTYIHVSIVVAWVDGLSLDTAVRSVLRHVGRWRPAVGGISMLFRRPSQIPAIDHPDHLICNW